MDGIGVQEGVSRRDASCVSGRRRNRSSLTGVTVVLVLVVGDQESVVLGGSGLLGEVLIFDLGKLDHFGGCGVKGMG